MSSGAVHKKSNIVVGVFCGATGFLYLPFELAMGAVLGLVAGTVVTPDYDLNAALPVSFMTRIPVVKSVWGIVWRPYQVMMKHRSFLSHAPIVSTALRCTYILGWVWCIMAVMHLWNIGPPPNILSDILYQHTNFWLIVFLMWSLQDFVHFVLDL